MTQSTSSKNSVKFQLKLLIDLQEIDFKISQLEKQGTEIPSQSSEARKNLASFKVVFDKKAAEIAEVEKVAKQVVAGLELNQDRIERTKKKLENVQNTKEFAAATKEIEQVEKLNEELEIKKTQSQEAVKAVRGDWDKMESELKSLQEKVAALNQRGDEQISKIKSDLAELNQSRRKYSDPVDPAVLSRYDRIRRGRQGVGIAPIINGQCQGCNMRILPQLMNQAITCREIVNCSSCHRIIYHPDGLAESGT